VTLTLTRPDDFHLHLRDGPELAAVVGHSAERFARAIVMPNLRPPITSTALALSYRDRIRAALPAGSEFEPLMTLYLTDRTDPAEVDRARASGAVHAIKYYPAGATTYADSGVTEVARVAAVLARMEELDLPLLVHGEWLAADVDPFDREKVFLERVLAGVVRSFPALRIVVEHATTREALDFVRAHPRVAATLTPQHLLLSRSALFDGGLRPHLYCLPVLKREAHRLALVEAATGGEPRFFLGTDSAPHARAAKESDCGCAGIYSAHAALELYAEVFDAAGRLDRLEAFASHWGADFYGLPRNRGSVTLERVAWQVPERFPFGSGELIGLRAGQPVQWRLVPRPRISS
jgi:dihydroorotase